MIVKETVKKNWQRGKIDLNLSRKSTTNSVSQGEEEDPSPPPPSLPICYYLCLGVCVRSAYIKYIVCYAILVVSENRTKAPLIFVTSLSMCGNSKRELNRPIFKTILKSGGDFRYTDTRQFLPVVIWYNSYLNFIWSRCFLFTLSILVRSGVLFVPCLLFRNCLRMTNV